MSWSLVEQKLSRDPFAELFDGIWNGRLRTTSPPNRPVAAPMNAWVREDEAFFSVELPGVKPSEVDVSIEAGTLKIRAETKAGELKEDERYHRRERYEGKLERTVTLPFRVDPKAVDARLEHGVLEVRLPRAEEDRPQKVQVKITS